MTACTKPRTQPRPVPDGYALVSDRSRKIEYGDLALTSVDGWQPIPGMVAGRALVCDYAAVARPKIRPKREHRQPPTLTQPAQPLPPRRPSTPQPETKRRLMRSALDASDVPEYICSNCKVKFSLAGGRCFPCLRYVEQHGVERPLPA